MRYFIKKFIRLFSSNKLSPAEILTKHHDVSDYDYSDYRGYVTMNFNNLKIKRNILQTMYINIVIPLNYYNIRDKVDYE